MFQMQCLVLSVTLKVAVAMEANAIIVAIRAEYADETREVRLPRLIRTPWTFGSKTISKCNCFAHVAGNPITRTRAGKTSC